MMECVIYDNYNPLEEYDEDIVWEEEFASLNDFFSGSHYLLMGSVGLWTGNHAAGTVFDDFEKMFYEAAKDCDYWKLWDMDGHFYFVCSHHDGTNCFEIRRLTDKGYDFIEEWNYNWSDKRREEEIHTIVWEDETMSELPHYAKKVYGGMQNA